MGENLLWSILVGWTFIYKEKKGSLATGTRVLTQSHMGQAIKDLGDHRLEGLFLGAEPSNCWSS